MKVIIINGPNLNLLGKREPSVYGNETFDTYFKQLEKNFPQVDLTYFQSNIEGEIIDKIHETGFSFDGIILNAAAYTHTSVGIADAVKGVETPVVEVHISNVYERRILIFFSNLFDIGRSLFNSVIYKHTSLN